MSAQQLACAHLDAHLAPIVAALLPDASAGHPDAAAIEAAARAEGAPLPLERLRSLPGMDAGAVRLLLTAVAVHEAPALARHLGVVPGTAQGPTGAQLEEAARAVGSGAGRAHRLGADHPLLRLGLVVPSLPAASWGADLRQVPLHVPGHWIATLRGERRLSDELCGVAARVVPTVPLELCIVPDEWRETLAHTVGAFLGGAGEGGPLGDVGAFAAPLGMTVVLTGPHGCGRTTLVKGLGQRVGRPVILVDGGRLAGAPRAAELLSVAVSEAQLYDELLCLQGAEAVLGPDVPLVGTLSALLLAHRACVFVLARAPGRLDARVVAGALLRYEVSAPNPRARALIWRALSRGSVALDAGDEGALDRLAEAVPLDGLGVRNALQLAAMATAGAPLTAEQLELAATLQARADGGRLVRGGQRRRGLDELVLAPETRAQILEIRDAMRHRHRILQEWGLERTFQRGLGIICLFDGPSGTGKTHTAECLAGEVGLELLQVRSAQITDKYIGEAEKRLEELFATTDPNRQLLLFDEADGFFSKRTEVTRASDRYANQEINTLLQLMESYAGLVVLTTNLRDQIDQAFERRITYKVTFAKPDADERERIWTSLLPPELPVDDVDCQALAHDYPLTGGGIKNAILRAAYAASGSGRVSQSHLAAAAEREAAASGILIRHRPHE